MKLASTSRQWKLQIRSAIIHHMSRNQPQSAASTSRSSFVNGEDDTTTESQSSFVQGKDDTTIKPLSAAECDYGNDNDSYEPYPHNQSNDNTSLGNDDEEECSLLHHLFAPPGSDDDEDGQSSASNLDAAASDNPYEQPGCGNELYLDPSEEAMLDVMVLLDSSGARHGLYDDLLMLLRKHSKRGLM